MHVAVALCKQEWKPSTPTLDLTIANATLAGAARRMQPSGLSRRAPTPSIFCRLFRIEPIESRPILKDHPSLADKASRRTPELLAPFDSLRPGSTPSADTRLRVDCEPAQRVLFALRRSVMRRTKMKIIQTAMKQSAEVETAPVAVLFSGGLDSMILSALLDQCLNTRYVIDLLNVSFDGQFAPDRVSARLGLKELQKFAPMRRWRLVEIDATLLNLTKETKHVMSLIHPADTFMDLNIGMAIWLAACGDGWVDGQVCSSLNRNQDHYKYKSEARVLLVGSGADEQCAGYGRHRTKYMHGGWLALHEEMRVDMQRIWKRNLGRDDRLISDHGKEARFPFLDEEVIQTLLEIPLWEIARLDEPAGKGDKKVLREVAQLLGLEGAAALPKRAIQFGSRIAKESNRKNFGSNRAANQASAGSAKVGAYQRNQ